MQPFSYYISTLQLTEAEAVVALLLCTRRHASTHSIHKSNFTHLLPHLPMLQQLRSQSACISNTQKNHKIPNSSQCSQEEDRSSCHVFFQSLSPKVHLVNSFTYSRNSPPR
jgi:hypothetical protein